MPENKFAANPNILLDKYIRMEILDRYYSLLMAENEKVNLVSRETTRPDFDRLAAESLLPLEFCPGLCEGYIDIGSGGGFPSFPLLLSGRIRGKSTLIERTGKKAAALERMAHQLGLEIEVIPRNFEELKSLPSVSLITIRLVRLTPGLLSKIMPRLSNHGSLAYYSSLPFPTDYSCRTITYHLPESGPAKGLTMIANSD